MYELGTGTVLLSTTNAMDHAYVELYADGKVRAGYYKDTARLYRTTDEAHARFKESFKYSGNHSAWNICYCLEDHLTTKAKRR